MRIWLVLVLVAMCALALVDIYTQFFHLRAISMLGAKQRLFGSEGEHTQLFSQMCSVPHATHVKLVLGVFSYDKVENDEAVHRGAWMQQPCVCILDKSPKPECIVYVAFVHGRGQGSRDVSKPEFGVLHLNVSENMNDGKTYAWFEFAAKTFKWATHIGKMDLDTYPDIAKLVTSLHNHGGDKCEAFVGSFCGPKCCGAWACCADRCPPKYCEPDYGNVLEFKQVDQFPTVGRTYKEMRADCWSYMAGALYILSHGLAENVSAVGGYWDLNRIGIEDVTTGKAVTEYARARHTCVSTWNPSAWHHKPKVKDIIGIR